jgi:hypothetical protein
VLTNDPVQIINSGKKSPFFGAFGSGITTETKYNTPDGALLSSRIFDGYAGSEGEKRGSAGDAPPGMGLLAVLAGRKAEERVGRAPADQAGREKDDPEVSPGGFGPHKGEGENGNARDDPDNSFYRTHVLFHDPVLLI